MMMTLLSEEPYTVLSQKSRKEIKMVRTSGKNVRRKKCREGVLRKPCK
jgi:hypothetical protein